MLSLMLPTCSAYVISITVIFGTHFNPGGIAIVFRLGSLLINVM